MKLTTLIPEIASLIDTDDITVSVASEICRYGVETSSVRFTKSTSKTVCRTIVGVA